MAPHNEQRPGPEATQRAPIGAVLHLGYATPENLAAFYAGVVDNIRAWLDGREPTPLSA
jgi:lactate dehydrogenase-like 2-hydroxyacid dehydrogenase